MKHITLYTDGGCIGNRRDANCPGGYGYLILDESDRIVEEGGGSKPNATNNIMEMVAVIKGLAAVRNHIFYGLNYSFTNDYNCIVCTDSRYVCDNYEDYLEEWKENGWKKSNGKPVLNKELWEELDGLTRGFRTFRFEWVKGHGVNSYNIRVDKIARSHMKSLSLST